MMPSYKCASFQTIARGTKKLNCPQSNHYMQAFVFRHDYTHGCKAHAPIYARASAHE